LLVLTAVVVGMAPAASANGVSAGSAVTTNPGTNAPLLSGGSATTWTLDLPAQAACAGDTANQGFHVYSFIVPIGTDPGTLTFNPSTGPSSGFPLVDTTGTAYIAANTAVNTGQVTSIPNFNFNLFATTSMGGTKLVLAPGQYRGGLACANSAGAGDRYWETIFTFTANGGDPNGEVWTAQPDHGVVAAPGCNAATTPGGQISQYPAWGGTQSGWKAACIFQSETHNPATNNQVTSNFTFHDFPDAIYHNGAARTVSSSAPVAAGNTFTMSDFGTATVDCAGATAFVNRSIAGTGIAPRTFVQSVNGACLVTLSKPVSGTINTTSSLKIDNSVARSIDDGTYANASTVIQSTSQGNCQASDAGLSVSGTDIPPGTTVVGCNGNGWNINNATTAAGTSPGAEVITIGGTIQSTDTREVGDATFTAIHTLVTPSARFVNPDDIGLPVHSFGANPIPQPCFITGVTNATTVTVSCTLVVDTPAAHRTDIGDPSATAPATGDDVMTQATQLALSPTLVAGSPNCNEDVASGFSIAGKWANPGSFTINTLATQPAGTKAVGEILFPTPVGLNYGAFVIERRALTAGDPQGAAHYDVVFPNVPTSSALCLSQTSPGLGFTLTLNSTTLSFSSLPTGTGRPGTAQVRAIKDDAQLGGTAQAFMTDNATNLWTGPAFNRICITPAGKPTVDFKCGTG
jgi:hypothetical protein